MHCFESEVTRNFLFALCLELNPCLERDDLLLQDVLNANGIVTVVQLFSLGEDALGRLVYEVVQELRVAA